MGGTLNAAIRTPDGKIHRTNINTSMIQDIAHRVELMEGNLKCYESIKKTADIVLTKDDEADWQHWIEGKFED